MRWCWLLIGCVGNLRNILIEMKTDQPVLPSGDDEIDLREVFAALQRRWCWVLGGGLLGLALWVGFVLRESRSAPLIRASLIVDVAQGPCFSRVRQLKVSPQSTLVDSSCFGELDSVRQELIRRAKSSSMFIGAKDKYANFSYEIGRLAFDERGKVKSDSHVILSVKGPPGLAPKILDELTLIKKGVMLWMSNKATAHGHKPFFGPSWIHIEKHYELERSVSSSRQSALGLLGGLVLGAGSALVADRRSNRVFSQAELLRRLGHPLRLGLPAAPGTSPAVPVLVGQLATQLDQNLSWRVLSIARQHEAVEPLTQLLQQQGGADLQCQSADPLLSAVLRIEPRDQPTGLLVVLEPGFNSASALEEAHLLISQMSNVQAVGVVLIGMPLPEELSSSLVG